VEVDCLVTAYAIWTVL